MASSISISPVARAISDLTGMAAEIAEVFIPTLEARAIGTTFKNPGTVDKVEQVYGTFQPPDATPPLEGSRDGIVKGSVKDRKFYILVSTPMGECQVTVLYEETAATAAKVSWRIQSKILTGSFPNALPLDATTTPFLADTIKWILESGIKDDSLAFATLSTLSATRA